VQVPVHNLSVFRQFYFGMRQGENTYGLIREFMQLVKNQYKG
jgi:hypothetical protein